MTRFGGIDWGRKLTRLEVIVALGAAVILFVVLATKIGPMPQETARKSTCLSNLHELGIALTTYCGDFDNKLPSSILVNHSKKWNQRDFQQFATRIGHLPTTLGAKRQTYAEVIYDYIKAKDIFFCVSDPVGRNDPNAPCSYYWKLAIDKSWYGEGCKKPHRLIEKDFPYSANTVVLYERQGFHHGNEALRNGVRINVVYMDCHVKSIELKNATSGDPANCAANSDGEPMYFNYNYATNKGLPDDKTPAKWVDPEMYGDKF